MINLRLPDMPVRPLPFYLAMEEWVAWNLPPADYFFVWRVEPTVICGRNQDISAEVDLDYCREAGIRVVRRRSGGGCVYADMDNYMFSYITPGDEIQTTFARYTTMIASMLRGLGIDAVATGRNDIVVGGRKISGNAFYHLPGRCIVHGTMLYGLDTCRMLRAITPSRAKLESKAVQSVPMRVTCLRDLGLSMGIDEFGEYAVASLTGSSRMLDAGDVAAIELIERRYYDPAFLAGPVAARNTPTGAVWRVRHFDGVGEVRAAVVPDAAGRIESLSFSGDFFLLSDPDDVIVRPLLGLCCRGDELADAVRKLDPGAAIAGLTADMLLELLTD